MTDFIILKFNSTELCAFLIPFQEEQIGQALGCFGISFQIVPISNGR